ncbi:cytidylyltransferase [Leptospira andrefontaineae]|uniref:Cytidylyltransferase n=1 Tax=Leptospira andrefontaineae TaxID=2484976 RepID=A0A4R9H8A5_9LEPT|nr:cytidylyltransferase [Leptospira andrefontaineae]TGK42262.1 cytidylyltransferase [Leptospira andrefontaineae]
MNMIQTWKIQRDYYYGKLFQEEGIDAVLKAGFFEDLNLDNVDIGATTSILCTPYAFLEKPKTDNHCVLLLTGALCPIHDGHLEMMIIAKESLEKEGYEVLGGYISPDHDDYVGPKTNSFLNIYERNRIVTEKIEDYPWIGLDPWNGVFNQTSINFTDVVFRLKKYLERNAKLKTKIFFLCGGDNFRFAEAFKYSEDGCVVVTRNGYEVDVKNQESVYLAQGENGSSSSEIRKFYKKKDFYDKNLKVRDDGYPIPEFLSKFFKIVEVVSLEKQREKLKLMSTENMISLDPMVPLNYNLSVSRIFDLHGHRKLGYKMEMFNEDSKLKDLSGRSDILLYDDDIYTGKTMSEAKSYLKAKLNISIDSFFSFNISPENYDLLDARDLYAFSKEDHCGLLIDFGDFQQRVPYAFPYVDPSIRSSVKDPFQFSIAVWRENQKFFSADQNLCLGHFPFYQRLYSKIGFRLETPIQEIFQWHIELLTKIQK